MAYAEIVAVFASALFAGAAVYITFVEHPARLSCGPAVALRQWIPSYKRATVMQASLAIIATFAGLTRWLDGREWRWLAGAILIFAVVPVTLLVIFPTNKKLLDAARDAESAETLALLRTWGRLHAIRSILGVAATLLFLFAR